MSGTMQPPQDSFGVYEWARRRTGPLNEEAVHDLSRSRYALTEIQIILKTARKRQKGGARGCLQTR